MLGLGQSSRLRLGLGREIVNANDSSNCRRKFMLICEVRVMATVLILVFEFSV